MALIPFCGEAAEAGISSGFQLLRQLNSTALRCRYVYAYENVAEHPQDRPEGIRPPDAGDTKAGTFIAKDRYGNKYYENLEQELPLRTRWVDYKDKELDPSQIEPGWHAWMSYLVDKPPTEDKLLQTAQRVWELPDHRMTLTASRAAYKPYSTTKPKYNAWVPEAAPR